MVEDYFWFKYYMKVINAEIMKNPNIELMGNIFYLTGNDDYQIYIFMEKRTNMINRIYSLLNEDDLYKFIHLFRRVLASYFGIVYDYDMDIMDILEFIKYFGKKRIIKFYKEKLTKYFDKY